MRNSFIGNNVRDALPVVSSLLVLLVAIEVSATIFQKSSASGPKVAEAFNQLLNSSDASQSQLGIEAPLGQSIVAQELLIESGHSSSRSLRSPKRVHLIVATLESPPFVMKRLASEANGTVEWYGYCVDFFVELIKQIPYEITYEIYQVSDNKFGSKDQQVTIEEEKELFNGANRNSSNPETKPPIPARAQSPTTSKQEQQQGRPRQVLKREERWNGLVGELHRARAHIALAPLAVMAERELVIDFTVPFYDLVGIQILLKKPEVPRDWFKFLTVLDNDVWLSIMVAYFVTSIVIFLFDRLSPYSHKNLTRIQKKRKARQRQPADGATANTLYTNPGESVLSTVSSQVPPPRNYLTSQFGGTHRRQSESFMVDGLSGGRREEERVRSMHHLQLGAAAANLRATTSRGAGASGVLHSPVALLTSSFNGAGDSMAAIFNSTSNRIDPSRKPIVAPKDHNGGDGGGLGARIRRLSSEIAHNFKFSSPTGGGPPNKGDDEDDDEDAEQNDDGRPEFGLRDSLWFCITSLTPQGGGEAPQNLSGRVVAGAWWLFCFIVIASYTANLAAFLTVSRLDIPIESLDDLAKQYRIKYAPVGGSAEQTYFERMAYIEEIFYNIWKEMSLNDSLSEEERSKFAVWDYPISDKYSKIWAQIREVGMPANSQLGIERVKESSLEDGFALLADANLIRHAVMTDCSFKAVGDEFSRKPIALGVQKGLDGLREDISYAILQLINQRFMEVLREKWWTNNPNRIQCETNDESEGISVENIGGVFIIILAGVILSFLVWAIERFVYRTKIEVSKGIIGRL